MNFNTFTHFWCFLELFIGKFIPNTNEHAQDYSCPGATLHSVHNEKSYLGKAWCCTMGNPPLKLPRGKDKFMWTVIDVRPCTEAKLTLGSMSCPEAMSCPGIMWTGPKWLFPASRGKVPGMQKKMESPTCGKRPSFIRRGKSLHQNQPSYRVFQKNS